MRDRKNQEALLYRAYIYMQRRDYKEARIDYNTLLQEEPKNKMGRLGMALLNQKELKFREALEEFNRMITDYWSRNKLWEECYIQSQIKGIFLYLYIAPIYINYVRKSLKCKKRNSYRKCNVFYWNISRKNFVKVIYSKIIIFIIKK